MWGDLHHKRYQKKLQQQVNLEQLSKRSLHLAMQHCWVFLARELSLAITQSDMMQTRFKQ